MTLYERLKAFYLKHNPGKLLRHPKLQCRLAAVRIIEVRDVYASREFDWGEMRAIALEEMEACRRTLVAQHLARSAS